ncbi:hypothetical protein TOK_3261 [Pseudonocardia sp. N23]|nr:hypothetical protein TOK_3261 [Pseudonocardia sp. N23]
MRSGPPMHGAPVEVGTPDRQPGVGAPTGRLDQGDSDLVIEPLPHLCRRTTHSGADHPAHLHCQRPASLSPAVTG